MTRISSLRPILRVVIAAAGQYFVGVTGGHAQDFDCGRARTPAERTICGSAELSRLDERMARAYGRLWSLYATGSGTDWERASLRTTQREFLAARDGCGDALRCLRLAYLSRIALLDGRINVAAR